MWILANYPPLQDGSGNAQFYLLSGRKYILGRKDCDIVISGDCSISRRHAVISVSKTDPADTVQPVEEISIIDTSKIGLQVNGGKIKPNEETILNDDDVISFGRLQIKFKLVYQRLSIVTSCINSTEAKATVKTCLKKLGGYMSQQWTDKSTHLVMEKVTFTIKVVCAIACGKPVVSARYLEDLLDCCDKKNSSILPSEKDYLPPISEQSLLHHQQLFHPNANRKSLMVGKLFIALTSQQHKRIKESIEFAGGDVLLKDNKDAKFVKTISSKQAIVLQVEKKDEKILSDTQKTWISEVYQKLKQHNLRPVRESEVGLAILNGSLASYCNPTLSSAPPISGSSHTQVLAESMNCTLDSQNYIQESCIHTLPSQMNMEVTHVNETIPIVSKQSFEVSVNQENIVTDRVMEQDADEHKNNGAAVKRKWRNVSLKDDLNEPIPIAKVGKKAKLEENKSKARVTKNNENEQRNIIHIGDDGEEDDVFSFNYSNIESVKRKNQENEDQIECKKQKADSHPMISESSVSPIDSSDVMVNGGNCESNVLFTSMSKKPIPDTCFLSVGASTKSKHEGGALIRSSTQNDYEDIDDDDDPFLFNVNELDKNEFNYNSKSTSKKRKLENIVDLDTSNTSANGSNFKFNDNRFVDMDKDNDKKDRDKKQKARFLKAVSNTQDSNAEGMYLSDEGNSLVTDLDEKIDDLENPIRDVAHDDEYVSSKEYSVRKRGKQVGLEGFISTSDKKPAMGLVKDEDSDLAGIDTQLVNIIFAPLVVTNSKAKEPLKECYTTDSKARNFKRFKKQCYAGRSKMKNIIGKNDLVPYESDNFERASLFKDIRERDEKEASENRRIDRMFEPMTCR